MIDLENNLKGEDVHIVILTPKGLEHHHERVVRVKYPWSVQTFKKKRGNSFQFAGFDHAIVILEKNGEKVYENSRFSVPYRGYNIFSDADHLLLNRLRERLGMPPYVFDVKNAGKQI